MPYYIRYPKRDHNFDNHPYDDFEIRYVPVWRHRSRVVGSLGFRATQPPFRHQATLEVTRCGTSPT